VVVVYLFLLISVLLTVAGKDRSVLDNTALWVAWAIAFVPLTAGFAAAVRVLSAADRGRSTRLTVIATGMLVLGVAIIVVDTVGGL
jgi:hypothetical protein